MIIKILGTGCPKCKSLYRAVEWAVKQLWIKATIQKVEDMNEIIQYDLMTTPGLVIDEKLIMTGKVPSIDELVKILPNLTNIKENSDCKPDSKLLWGCCCGSTC